MVGPFKGYGSSYPNQTITHSPRLMNRPSPCSPVCSPSWMKAPARKGVFRRCCQEFPKSPSASHICVFWTEPRAVPLVPTKTRPGQPNVQALDWIQEQMTFACLATIRHTLFFFIHMFVYRRFTVCAGLPSEVFITTFSLPITIATLPRS